MIRFQYLFRPLLFAAFVLMAGCEAKGGEKAPQYLPATPLVIETSAGKYRFNVEMAETEEQQKRGLMYRPRLPDDGGMLFVYDKPEAMAFWMKNTPEPLDILFILADGHIARIAAGNKPWSLKAILSGGPVLAALEIRGGRAAEIGAKAGDLVRHARFRNFPAGS